MKTVAEIFRSYGVLDEHGRHVNGTDKETNHHYGDTYQRLLECRFDGLDKVKLMMEVGVADGSSLLAWRDIFPNALCVGLDIHHSDKASDPHDPRLEFHLGDQRSRADCERSAAGRQFDLIVEDATHCLANTMLTLFWLWPFVKPGGLYVVEEWENVDRGRIRALWPFAEVVPQDSCEPLVVFRRPK